MILERDSTSENSSIAVFTAVICYSINNPSALAMAVVNVQTESGGLHYEMAR